MIFYQFEFSKNITVVVNAVVVVVLWCLKKVKTVSVRVIQDFVVG